MSRLIDDLLDVSRITLGKVELRLDRTDLRQAVNAAVETARPLVDTRGHELFVHLPAEHVFLQADGARIQQVVSNLLNNAAKYTPEGGRIELSLKVEAADAGGSQAVVRVRDTGVGIQPELLPRIFDLFAQGDQGLARSQGGLGIGLTLAQNLIRLHGGTLQARSDGSGRGAEMVVRLPLRDDLQVVEPTARETPAETRTLRVLIIDDHADAAETLGELIEHWGHEVRTAQSGAAGLRAALDFDPEVVLLDLGMPGMDGFEVARRLRAEPAAAGVKLVALTGYGQEEHRRLAEEAGFDLHMTKPVEPDVLKALLQTPHQEPLGAA
jgi:CheY-like chemotaxis protein/two-component sensor histidine kinase